MSGGSRDDVGRFTVSCTSIQFLCLIFLVSCPIFVDKCTGGMKEDDESGKGRGTGEESVSPRETLIKSQSQSLQEFLYMASS